MKRSVYSLEFFIGIYVGLYQIVANWRLPAVLKWGYKSFFILGIDALYYVLFGLPVCCLIWKNLIVCSEFDLVCCNDC